MLLYLSVQTEERTSGSVSTCDLPQDVSLPHNSVVFSLKNQVGGLARALQVFQVRKLHIYCINMSGT
jgi:prephenate dehydratase